VAVVIMKYRWSLGWRDSPRRSDIGEHGEKKVNCPIISEYLINRVECVLQDKSNVDIFRLS